MNKQISVQIQDVMGESWSFDNLRALYEFLKDELTFWEKQRQGLQNPHQYFTQNNNIQQLCNIINSWEEKLDEWDEARLQNEIRQQLNGHLNNLRSHWLWSGHAFVPAWVESWRLSPHTGQGFIEAVKERKLNNPQNYDYFRGHVLAYEHDLQAESNLTKRRNSEKQSIAQLRKRLDEQANTLIKEVDEFQQEYSGWYDETRRDIERKMKAQRRLFCISQSGRKKSFETFMNESGERIQELENTYHEKLRLEKPAQYWNRKAASYKTHGVVWSSILAAFLVTGLVAFGYAFYQWLQSESLGIELNSLQGVVLFVTTLAIYVFLIKSIAKLTFSSFHLQRDAEEREQLTHVYLALTNEQTAIDEESRKIVLQALFSRAETGLLSTDSSPTMPGLHELIRATGVQK